MNTLSILSTEIRQLDGLYSLNDLHKAAGGEAKHKPDNFLRVDQTKALITEIEQVSDLRLAIKAIHGGNNRGSYACRELVYAYAMWISPKFHLQVIRAFDALHRPQPDALQRLRMLVTVENGQISDVRHIPADALVMTPGQITDIIGELMPLGSLPGIIAACVERLAGAVGGRRVV